MEMDSSVLPQGWQVPEFRWHVSGTRVPDLGGTMLGVSGIHQPGVVEAAEKLVFPSLFSTSP